MSTCVLSQINPIHAVKDFYFKIYWNSVLANGLVPGDFLRELLYKFLLPYRRIKYYFYKLVLILLDDKNK